MPIGTSEIAWPPALLDPISLTGVVVTADALHTTRHRTGKANYVVTSLADPAVIAEFLRGPWRIENRPHWVRDVTYGKDASRVRTGHPPRMMARPRNLAISALRHLTRDSNRPLRLPGITV